MGLIKKFLIMRQTQKVSNLIAEEELYKFVNYEVESGNVLQGLWIKASTSASSSQLEDIKREYIRLRVERLKEEGKLQNRILEEDSINADSYAIDGVKPINNKQGLWVKTTAPSNSSITGASGINYYTWDQWYRLYKIEAGLANSALAENMDGTSLFDFMDKEPLKRAHRDNICPMKLGRQFASTFDARTFGL